MDDTILKEMLDKKVAKHNSLNFIEDDPILVPHRYAVQQDIEIAGFFSSILAWGNRKTIISKSLELMQLMDNHPYDFIKNHQEKERKSFLNFKHRTFQATDILYFLDFLQRHYSKYSSLESAFIVSEGNGDYDQKVALVSFHNYFFDHENAPARTKKHISTPQKHSTCKRLNMFLRWMVRDDEAGVDFGIWKNIPKSKLMIPLDVHVEKMSRDLGILTRKQRDWTAVEEITKNLRRLNPDDPTIYDFALFGMGIEAKKGDLIF